MSETKKASKPVSQVQQALKDVLETLKTSETGSVALYEEAARRLSEVAGKTPPWGYRYVKSVESGTVGPSQKFGQAVMALGAMMDGMPAVVAGAEPVTVYARPGLVRSNAIILLESQPCGNPGCPVQIVSRGKYCSDDCRRAARRIRDRERRRVRRLSEAQKGE